MQSTQASGQTQAKTNDDDDGAAKALKYAVCVTHITAYRFSYIFYHMVDSTLLATRRRNLGLSQNCAAGSDLQNTHAKPIRH